MKTGGWGVLVAALGVILFGGCRETSAVETPREVLRPTAVTYSLTWALGSAQRTAMGWQVMTDRGYTVEVTAGRLSTHTVTLVPCVAQAGRWDIPPLLGAGVALAGHSTRFDPSTWLNPPLEDLARLEGSAPHRVWFPATNYCDLHLLVARPPGSVPGKISGASLQVVGTWRKGDGATHLLEINTSLANGALRSLGSLPVPDGELNLSIQRDISHLFDGIEFEVDKSTQVQRQVLVNLVGGISVVGGGSHGRS